MSKSRQRTIPSHKVREQLTHLMPYNSLQQVSDLLREEGQDVDADTLGNIWADEVKRTHPLHKLGIVFFDNLAPADDDAMDVARTAFVHHEIIAITLATNDTANGIFALQLEAAAAHYRLCRPTASGLAANILDYVHAQVILRRVEHELYDNDETNLELFAIKKLAGADKLLRDAITGFDLAARTAKAPQTDFVEYFLVRTLEARFLANYYLDQRQDAASMTCSRRLAADFTKEGRIALLLDNATKTKHIPVAFNAAELAALADHTDLAVKALLLAFDLHPPTSDGWSLPGMLADPAKVPYLAPVYLQARKIFGCNN